MKHFFISGTHPLLSLAEIASLFEVENISLNWFITKNESKLNPETIKSLGGIIKFGEIVSSCPNLGELDEIIYQKLIDLNRDSKISFGLSFYGFKTKDFFKLKKIGLNIKKNLRQDKISARVVSGENNQLSSATVENNNLIKKGAEFVILKNGDEILIGKTIAVQAFKELSFRDFGRPQRDDKSGMLPPKVAQIMINLSQTKKDELVLDPFCGSGTIPGELLLMGYKKIIGTDISDKAVSDSRENIKWLENNFQIKANVEIFQSPAQNISREIKKVKTIVTEPYLGPQRGGIDYKKSKNDLDILYSDALRDFKNILDKGSRVVMIWPVMNSVKDRIFLNPNIYGYKIINPFNDKLLKQILNSAFSIPKNFNERPSLIYHREGQRISREIVILEKK